MPAEREPYLSASEVAAWLGLDESTVRDHAAHGVIPATRVGGVWRFLGSRVELWLDQQSNQRPRLVAVRPRKPEPTTGRRQISGRRA